jgi:hypothetical protein
MANFGAMPFETDPDGKIVYGAHPARMTEDRRVSGNPSLS